MKRLMYLSVSLLCLSLTFLVGIHLQQREAEAQSSCGNVICMTEVDSRNEVWVAVEPADIYKCSATSGNFSYFGTVPGGKRIAAMSQGGDGNVWVVLEDGQWGVVAYIKDSFEWHSTGSPNICGGVATEAATWGSLKQKFVK